MLHPRLTVLLNRTAFCLEPVVDGRCPPHSCILMLNRHLCNKAEFLNTGLVPAL